MQEGGDGGVDRAGGPEGRGPVAGERPGQGSGISGPEGRLALSGIRVVDFSRVIAGPLCTQQLADLGAEVIKIESPEGGDDTRRLSEPGAGGHSHFFLAFNRSKRSLALDVRTPRGREIARELVRAADVVVENFRPGVMARLGLDWEGARALNPRLVYVSISAYGQEGPMADRPGFDPVLQAESGMMALTGEPDGPPLRHPLSIIDTMTALQAVGAICAALYRRERTGGGERIDLALHDVAIAALGNAGLYYLCSGEVPPRTGNSHMTATPTSLFEAADGPMYLALATDRLFRRLCGDVLERPDLAEDERFRTSADRLANRPELMRILSDIFRARPRAEWLERMRHLPAGPVRTIAEALTAPEVEARSMVRTISMPDGEEVRVLGSPVRLSEGELAPFRPPPGLGADTDAVLEELLGLDEAELAALRREGVIR